MNRLLMIATVSATLRAFLLPFAYYFRAQGWQVDAIAAGASTSPECLQAFDRVWDIEWSRNPLAANNLIAAPRKIQEVVTQGKYDLIHVHTPVAAFVTRYALKNLRQQTKCKVIYTAHGFHFHPQGKLLKNLIFLTLEKLAGVWTDYLVTINREDELAAKRYQLLPPEQIRYMPGIGVALDYYSPHAVANAEVKGIQQELGMTPASSLFLCIAEFIPRKHHSDIIKAFAKLPRSDVHLAFAGRGPLLEQMQQLASNLGVANRTHFLGRRDDIPALVKAAVATILVSEQEGLPRSVMESLALATPVIGTKIRGTQELLTGGCGLLVEVGDIEGIATAMGWMLEHPEQARIMGKLGRTSMADYDLQHILKLHEALYLEALKGINQSSHSESCSLNL